MAQKCCITVDIGSTNVKAARVLLDGSLDEVQKRRLSPQGNGEIAEIPAEELYNAVAELVRSVLPKDGTEILAVGAACQMSGLVLLDEDCRPLFPAIYGIDTRGDAFLGELARRVPAELLYEVTRCPKSGIYWPGKLLWLWDRSPERMEKVRHVLGIKDYILFRLTGSLVTDHASASTTQMYRQKEGRWWGGLISALNLEPSYFPEIRQPFDLAGNVEEKAGKETGLAKGIPVAVGSGDGPSANVACGALRQGDCCISFGTTTVTRFLTDRLIEDIKQEYFCQHFYNGWYFQGIRLNNTGRDVETYMRLSDGKREDAQGCFFMGNAFLPRDPGRPGMRFQAVMDSVLFRVYSTMESAVEQAGIQRLYCTGGGSRDIEWMQKFSDLFQMEIVLQNHTELFGGVAAFALVCTGEAPNLWAASKRIKRKEFVLRPGDGAGIWNAYQDYQAALKTWKGGEKSADFPALY